MVDLIDEEYTQTKAEYDSDSIEVAPLEKTAAEIHTIATLNTQAHVNALLRLVSTHKTEYERLVVDERKTLTINDDVSSAWLTLIETNEV